ncbi:putative ABC transporter [Hypoxylon sp. FL1150]|nr:putative ABC transporter [Hypoxylon sp. FL1150]
MNNHAYNALVSRSSQPHSRSVLMATLNWGPAYVVHLASAICSSVFLLFLPVRLWQLRLSRIKPKPGLVYLPKAILGALLCGFLFIQLLSAFRPSGEYETSFILSLATSLAAALGLTLLLPLELWRALKPSDLGTLYLVSSILLDVVLLTLPSDDQDPRVFFHPILSRCLLQSALLILEFQARGPIPKDSRRLMSPEELSCVLGRAFFFWINPMLLGGFRKILINEDLPPLSKVIKPGTVRPRIIRAWDSRAKPETQRTLPLALLNCVLPQFLAAILPRVSLIVFRYAQPILIKQSIKYITAPPVSNHTSYGYWLTVAALVIYTGLAISTAVYQNCLNRLKLLTRSALVGLIHHKTIDSPATSYYGNDGEAITLMSTDVDSLDGMVEMFHETWAQILEVVIGLVLLAREVGWLWPLPIVLIFFCSRVSHYVAKFLKSRQKDWNDATQYRVAALSSMLGSMKMIKMLGFQSYVSIRVRQLRLAELSAASKVRWMMVYYNASANALGIFSPAITLSLFAVMANARGDKLDTEAAFTSIAILAMITHPANMVMTIVPRAIAAFAGFERIQDHLLRPSLCDKRSTSPSSPALSTSRDLMSGQLAHPSHAIRIEKLSIGSQLPILQDVDLEIAPGSVTVISGPVGSGKSTLLRTILGETTPSYGSISVSTRRIGYCAQLPWLPNGSIKEAIFGISDFGDSQWYQRVTNACCLAQDFDSLSAGDDTDIGSRGVNLSGGQRQRVALARAVFARCEILLLDDVFSSLDGNTEQTIIENLLGTSGLFRQLQTTVVVVSNSAQYYHLADQVVILSDGTVKEKGTWQELQAKGGAIDKFVQKHPTSEESDASSSQEFVKLRSQLRAKDEAEMDLARQTGDLSLYGYYLRFIGWLNFFLLSGCSASCAFFITIPQYWLELWTGENYGSSILYYVCGYLLLSLASWTSTNGMMWSTQIRLAPRSGLEIHQYLLETVIRAPLSYFSKTESGSILNRFSQDIQLVDKQLPSAFSHMGIQIYKLFMQIILLFTAQKWLALSLPICMLVVYIVQKVYLRTSRQLRFLELESRAAVFSNFLETVEGLETLRAFGWQKAMVEENILRLDHSQRPEFCLLCLQRWLNIVLDLLAAAIATLIVVITITLREQTTGGQVGVALNIVLLVNATLLKLVESWTTVEISLGAISRVKTLEETTPSEVEERECGDPPSSWPYKGSIELENVIATYDADSVAIRNFSLTIEGGQKVIVCGRTGSGKSSLLMTLLRLLDLQAGTIKVDGVDISHLPRDLLRQRCFIVVSQDSLLLTDETLRYNLDPGGSLPDHVLVEALTRTGLWKHFATGVGDGASSNEDAILGKRLSVSRKLSFGQCQLFAMARALVKAEELRVTGTLPVVLLDEVTAALDAGTESIIYDLIEQEFTAKGHTVIMVTHRAGVVSSRSRDLVLWMNEGRLEEVALVKPLVDV